jgi:agmatinase
MADAPTFEPGTTTNYFEVTYADLPTFGKAPLTPLDQLEGIEVAAYGIPWDITASPRPGARLGPRRIREETHLFREVWDPIETPMISLGVEGERTRDSLKLADCGDAMIFPYDIERTRDSVQKVSAAVAKHAFPIAIGGDHYVMYPAYQGVVDANPGKKIGVLQIDAHDDTISDDPVLGPHWCGSPIARAMEYGDIPSPAVAMCGLRNFIGAKQVERHRDEGFVVITMDKVRELGMKAMVEQAMSSILQHCDLVYLTIDIDGADPSVAPGCAGPSPGGFLGHEWMDLMRVLGNYEEICAMDLVEVAPQLDPTEQTPLFAAFSLFHFIESRFLSS